VRAVCIRSVPAQARIGARREINPAAGGILFRRSRDRLADGVKVIASIQRDRRALGSGVGHALQIENREPDDA